MASNVRENVVAHLENLRKTDSSSFPSIARERFGGGWLTDYLLDPANEDFFEFLFDSSAGTKSRIGIATFAILAWEANRRAMVPAVEAELWRVINKERLVESKLNEMRPALVDELKAELLLQAEPAPAPPKSSDSGLDELRLDMSREFVRISEQLKLLSDKVAEPPKPPVIPEVPLAQLNEQVSVINQKLVAEAERREALAEARAAREARDKAVREERLASEEKARVEKKAEKLARQRKRAEERKAKKVRRREIAAIKKAGGNPYTESETRDYIAKLEAKGKTYYTPEQRAEYKAALGEERKNIVQKSREKRRRIPLGDTSKSKFVNYTPEQKAQFVKENFTDKGKRYYTKEERQRHKLGMKKKKLINLGAPVEGPQETSN